MKGDNLPPELHAPMHRAIRLEYWNIFWTLTIIVGMGLVLGQSETMKTAWVEDTLGLVPPIMFLIARAWKKRAIDRAAFPSASNA